MKVKSILFQLLLLCVTALAMLSEAESKADVPDNLNEILHTLGRQIMLQKLDMEESVRATYASGVKQIRQASKGSQPYHVAGKVDSFPAQPRQLYTNAYWASGSSTPS